MIKRNPHKYSVSAMCRILKVSRSTYYYKSSFVRDENELTKKIIGIFEKSRNNNGTRKIKVELKKDGIIVSRRCIGRIMKENGLVSQYTVAQYKVHKPSVNESETPNIVERYFDEKLLLHTIVSDLTYVRVNGNWNYLCILLDLHNREIVGHSTGANEDAALVSRVFVTVKADLKKIEVLHTDRGREFDNKLIRETLDTFEIKHSLSSKG